MYFIIYKTINRINNQYYIGKHQTNDLDDGYLGSGKLIRQAIKKFGLENFDREILEYCHDEDHMNEREKIYVTWSEVNDHECYNMTVGGTGGPIRLGKTHSDESCKKISESRKGIRFSEEHKAKLREAAKNRKSSNRKGSKHSEESKEKIKIARAKQEFSNETRQKFSERSKKMWADPEMREKILDSRKGNINDKAHTSDWDE